MKSLNELALHYGTDKSTILHCYCEFYEQYFSSLRDEKIKFIELGVKNGASLQMWRDYFCNGAIHGVDIKNCPKLRNITTHKVDASNSKQLEEIAKLNKWDIVLDDASHQMAHQQIGLDVFWDNIKDGGFFIMEDLQSSFNVPHNPNNITTTYKILSQIKYGKIVHSDVINKERLEHIIDTIDFIDIVVTNHASNPNTIQRVENLNEDQLTVHHSMTCIIKKR